MHSSTTERSKYYIVQSIPQNTLRRIMRYSFIITVSTINSLLWSGPDTINNTCDPTQGQTRIFYKPGQVRLTETKHMTWLTQLTWPCFIPGSYICIPTYIALWHTYICTNELSTYIHMHSYSLILLLCTACVTHVYN